MRGFPGIRLRYNERQTQPFGSRLRDAKVPPKLAGLVPTLVTAALFALGLVIAGTYVVVADRVCQVAPVTPAAPPPELPVRHSVAFDLLQAPALGDPPRRWAVRFFCEAKAADLAVVFLIYCLAIGAGWLAWATLGLWRTGEQQIGVAKMFAEATLKSADTTATALTRLERPYILPSAVGESISPRRRTRATRSDLPSSITEGLLPFFVRCTAGS